MLWQIGAATILGFLFYAKRVGAWAQKAIGPVPQRLSGFAFATVFAVVTSPVTLSLFQAHPLPRFNDVFLVGIVLTAYLFTWESAAYLLCISIAVSAWILPPYGTLYIQEFADWYRLISFALLSTFLICLITRMKSRRLIRRSEERSFSMSRAAAGAD
jgi:hypothetical protein